MVAVVAVVAAMAAQVEVVVVGKAVAAVEDRAEVAVTVAVDLVLLVSSFFAVNFFV